MLFLFVCLPPGRGKLQAAPSTRMKLQSLGIKPSITLRCHTFFAGQLQECSLCRQGGGHINLDAISDDLIEH